VRRCSKVAAWRWSWPRKTTRFSAGREGISERDIEAGRRAAATSTETIPAKPSSPVRPYGLRRRRGIRADLDNKDGRVRTRRGRGTRRKEE
jgi:hypothetical protein